MMFPKRRKTAGATLSSSQSTGHRGVEFAWRTHGAITDWTAKVDSKASIVLSFGGVFLGFLVTLSGKHRVLADLQGWRLVVERIGIVSTALAVLLTALVVAPRLNRRLVRQTWRDNFVYFGHLRHWQPAALKKRLEALSIDQELDVLANQLVATSKIAWYKHSMLQFAMASLVLGAALTTVSVVWP